MNLKGILAIAFGAFSALSSLLALLYLAGFIQNRYSFSTIDSGLQIPVSEAMLVNLGLLGLFGLQHSGMARRSVKRLMPELLERSAYLVATAIVLAVLFYRWEPMPQPVWFTPIRWPFLILVALGAVLVVWSVLWQGALHFFAYHQVLAYARGRTYTPPPFRATGLYRYTRHPMMIGSMLYIWPANDMTQGHLLFAVVMTAYVLMAVRWEERDLVRTHGESYREYSATVRRF